MRIHYLLLALFSFDLHVSGQEVNITFDEKDYGSVSAYDYWTGSPLSERQLDRLAEVTDNPFSDARNSGGKVLSFRRSHHGSHLCGAKITLIEPLGLTPKTGYLHGMKIPCNSSNLRSETFLPDNGKMQSLNFMETIWPNSTA